MNDNDIDMLIGKACGDRCNSRAMPDGDFFDSIAARALRERRQHRLTRMFRISVAAMICMVAGSGVAYLLRPTDRSLPAITPENIFYSEGTAYVEERIEASCERHAELRESFDNITPFYSDTDQ
ncbi:MAG: hypothetical protein HDR92_02080 [Bacteroides sp.]|nr:hypothetical protein [Bacteroides sp.]